MANKGTSGKSQNTSQENEDNQSKLIFELLNELRLVNTENYVGVQLSISGNNELIPIDDERIINYTVHELYDRYKIWAKTSTIKSCISYMKYEGYLQEKVELKHRIANDGDSIIYDLCDGNCVVVNKDGWNIRENDYMFFRHSVDQAPQVKPIRCENGWERLKKYLNIPDNDKILFIAYIVACFNPQYTFPSLCINGASGSGKSTMTKLIKNIIDPSFSDVDIMTNSFDDLKVRLDSCYYAAFDNLSRISNSMSDFLCTVITGGTYTTRKKYENNTPFIIRLKHGMCLNGIGNFVVNGDLVDRVLFMNTKPFQGAGIGDSVIKSEFQNDLPYIMGGIFDLLSKAINLFPTAKIENPIRLVDFHKFGYSIAEAMGGYGEEFNQALNRNRERQLEIVDENFEILRILVDFLIENDGEWSSTVEMLWKSLKNFVELDDEGKYNPKAIPKAANSFSKLLNLHEADLAKRGFRFDKKKNGEGAKVLTFHTDRIIRKPITGIRKPIIFEVDKIKLRARIMESYIGESENDNG